MVTVLSERSNKNVTQSNPHSYYEGLGGSARGDRLKQETPNNSSPAVIRGYVRRPQGSCERPEPQQ